MIKEKIFYLLKKLRLDARSSLLRKMPRNAFCVEIGVWKAEFSEKIYNTTKPLELHLVDPWMIMPEYPHRSYGRAGSSGQPAMDAIYEKVRKQYDLNPTVKIHRKTSIEASSLFKDNTIDWIYLDANHSERAVYNDLVAYFPKIKKNGYLTGDDYYWQDESGHYSVQTAVQKFISAHPVTMKWKRRGQFILRKQ